MKLNRLVARHQSMGRAEANRVIAARLVRVNGTMEPNSAREITRFDEVGLEGEYVQKAERAIYLMLHKPVGILSATKDAEHRTVIDLIDDPDKDTLHIAGRLDRSTSGLVLLTNDGRWSKQLMDAESKVPKVYLVETSDDIAPEAVHAFASGFHFHTEDITTLPAQLEILAPRLARLTLHEGRYHQVKRMFHRVQNRVISLYRESIGGIALPTDLAPGQWRPLTDGERLSVQGCIFNVPRFRQG